MIYIIPCTISDQSMNTIPLQTIDVVHKTRHYIVERIRTARRYIAATSPPYAIDDLEFIEIDRKNLSHLQDVERWFSQSLNIGLLSESGMPSVADPGSGIIALAHRKNVAVRPLVGPSSILLALSASGFNGQEFCFKGYLPIRDAELKRYLKDLESEMLKSSCTQIFIETPYRNDRLLKLMCECLNNDTHLCIARDITGKSELIQRKAIRSWRKDQSFSIGKLPTIFLIGK